MLHVSAPTVCVSWGDFIERPCLWCNGSLGWRPLDFVTTCISSTQKLEGLLIRLCIKIITRLLMHTFWLVMKVHLIKKKHHYMFVRSHFWPILSVFQWSRARPSGRSPFSRGPWSERRALTSPSGVTWPATRKESSKTSNGPCTFTPLPIERSVSWARPSTTTPTPCLPSASTARRSTSRG